MDVTIRTPPAQFDIDCGSSLAQTEMQIGAALAGMAVATIDLGNQFPPIGKYYGGLGTNGRPVVSVHPRMAGVGLHGVRGSAQTQMQA